MTEQTLSRNESTPASELETAFEQWFNDPSSTPHTVCSNFSAALKDYALQGFRAAWAMRTSPSETTLSGMEMAMRMAPNVRLNVIEECARHLDSMYPSNGAPAMYVRALKNAAPGPVSGSSPALSSDVALAQDAAQSTAANGASGGRGPGAAPSNVASTEIKREQIEALRYAAKYFEQYGFSHMEMGYSWTGAGLAEALQMLEARLCAASSSERK